MDPWLGTLLLWQALYSSQSSICKHLPRNNWPRAHWRACGQLHVWPFHFEPGNYNFWLFLSLLSCWLGKDTLAHLYSFWCPPILQIWPFNYPSNYFPSGHPMATYSQEKPWFPNYLFLHWLQVGLVFLHCVPVLWKLLLPLAKITAVLSNPSLASIKNKSPQSTALSSTLPWCTSKAKLTCC